VVGFGVTGLNGQHPLDMLAPEVRPLLGAIHFHQ
jgi:hypothetical protein